MPVLPNLRHERFAQGLAEGNKSQEQAYIDAGYKPKGAAAGASSLRKKPEVIRRVTELLDERRAETNSIKKVALVAAAYDATRIVKELAETIQSSDEVMRRSLQYEPVLDENGNVVKVLTPHGEIAAAYTFNASGANQANANKIKALHLLGIDVGRFVNRHEVRRSPIDSLPPELVRKLEQALAIAISPPPPGLERLPREPVTIEGERPGPERSDGAAAGGAEGAPGGSPSKDR
jgi:phage terminase small subunit